MRPSRIDVFVYGTLKRGERNHACFCGGARRMRPATVRGLLYDLPYGYPALLVPEEDVWAVGTTDPLRDAEEARRLGFCVPPGTGGPKVYGELFTFYDPADRLPALDRLEGFAPEAVSSPYKRVLLPAYTPDGDATLAWAYVAEKPSGTHLPGGSWPP